ncbi:MAG TPA: hypothetical protein VFG03_16860 [Telluria sp.]|nr:hypothetical protein [Telluria sp.]
MFSRFYLPSCLTLLLVSVLLLHGPIPQPLAYHAFADTRSLLGMPNGADVLSNLGFLLAGAYGLVLAWRSRAERGLRAAYAAFFGALVLTAFGSAYYHLAPDNARLVWDRLPIAMACAALLAAAARDYLDAPSSAAPLLVAIGVGSVGWWAFSGDLRPYLMVQLLPLALIPVMQWQARAPRHDRIAFGCAIGLYVAAKLCETFDGALFDALGLSGHTLKHLLAALAAVFIARHFRDRKSRDSGSTHPPFC